MNDRIFVANARESWARVIAMQDRPGVDGNTLSVAAALWASINAEGLLRIASQGGQHD